MSKEQKNPEPTPTTKIILLHRYKHEREELRERLSAAGLAVTAAGSADEGVRCALRIRPELILVHHRWPAQSYLTLCETLGRISINGLSPYLVLLRPPHQKGEEKVERDAGIRDYIFLPRSPEDICSQVAELVKIAKERDAVPAWEAEKEPAPATNWGFLFGSKGFEKPSWLA